MSQQNAPAAPAGPDAMAGSARRLGALTMLSRLLGLAREMVFSDVLGAGIFSDAYVAAFRVPNLLRDLFAEGALSQAFVPIYKATEVREGAPSAFALANRVSATLLVYLGALAALAMLLPQPVVTLVASKFSAETASVCADLVRIMMPILPLVSLAAVAMGVLNAARRFTAPGLASSMFNLVSIAGGGVLWVLRPGLYTTAIVWSAFTLAAGFSQLAIQMPSLRRTGFRWSFTPDLRLRDRGTREIAALMGPAALAVAAVQVNVLINSQFASAIVGAQTWLYNAFRLMQLPIGVVGVAMGTVATSQLAEDAAGGDMDALRATLRRGVRFVLFLTVPATVGLYLLALPVVTLIFQHGAFTANSAVQTARALSAYALGLAAYSAVKVVVPAFYTLRRPRLPFLASVSAVAVNVAWNFATFDRLGHVGLALGTSVAAAVNLGVLVIAFQVRVGGFFTRDLAGAVARIALASLAMAGAVILVDGRLAGAGRAVRALVPVAAGAAVYFAAAAALRLPEAAALRRRFTRR